MERTTSLRRRPAARSASITSAKPKTKTAKRVRRSDSPKQQLPVGLHVHSQIGARPYMEDAYGYFIKPDAVVFGVFDGHGGDSCSKFCATSLCQRVASHESLHKDPAQTFSEVFTKLDEEYCEAEGDAGAGSTATAIVLRRCQQTKRLKLDVGYVGDSSAMIIRGDDSFEMLTTLHHGTREDERVRIENLGGKVTFDNDDKVYRVQGILAVTRAIGDAYLKPFVTSTPETQKIEVDTKDIVVVGSDGLWDETDPSTVVKTMREAGIVNGLRKLVDSAARVGDDNVCAMALDIGAAVETHLVTSSGSTE